METKESRFSYFSWKFTQTRWETDISLTNELADSQLADKTIHWQTNSLTLGAQAYGSTGMENKETKKSVVDSCGCNLQCC